MSFVTDFKPATIATLLAASKGKSAICAMQADGRPDRKRHVGEYQGWNKGLFTWDKTGDTVRITGLTKKGAQAVADQCEKGAPTAIVVETPKVDRKLTTRETSAGRGAQPLADIDGAKVAVPAKRGKTGLTGAARLVALVTAGVDFSNVKGADTLIDSLLTAYDKHRASEPVKVARTLTEARDKHNKAMANINKAVRKARTAREIWAADKAADKAAAPKAAAPKAAAPKAVEIDLSDFDHPLATMPDTRDDAHRAKDALCAALNNVNFVELMEAVETAQKVKGAKRAAGHVANMLVSLDKANAALR